MVYNEVVGWLMVVMVVGDLDMVVLLLYFDVMFIGDLNGKVFIVVWVVCGFDKVVWFIFGLV